MPILTGSSPRAWITKGVASLSAAHAKPAFSMVRRAKACLQVRFVFCTSRPGDRVDTARTRSCVPSVFNSNLPDLVQTTAAPVAPVHCRLLRLPSSKDGPLGAPRAGCGARGRARELADQSIEARTTVRQLRAARGGAWNGIGGAGSTCRGLMNRPRRGTGCQAGHNARARARLHLAQVLVEEPPRVRAPD